MLFVQGTQRDREDHASQDSNKAGVKPWMGKRNPVTLVSIVVKRNIAVVTGNLCEANTPPTTISQLPIATRVITTCKTVKVPTHIPRIMDSPVVNTLTRSLKSAPVWLHYSRNLSGRIKDKESASVRASPLRAG